MMIRKAKRWLLLKDKSSFFISLNANKSRSIAELYLSNLNILNNLKSLKIRIDLRSTPVLK